MISDIPIRMPDGRIIHFEWDLARGWLDRTNLHFYNGTAVYSLDKMPGPYKMAELLNVKEVSYEDYQFIESYINKTLVWQVGQYIPYPQLTIDEIIDFVYNNYDNGTCMWYDIIEHLLLKFFWSDYNYTWGHYISLLEGNFMKAFIAFFSLGVPLEWINKICNSTNLQWDKRLKEFSHYNPKASDRDNEYYYKIINNELRIWYKHCQEYIQTHKIDCTVPDKILALGDFNKTFQELIENKPTLTLRSQYKIGDFRKYRDLF